MDNLDDIINIVTGSHMRKNHYNKELVMNKEDDENFENSAKYWICSNTFVEGDVEVKYHYYVTGKIGVLRT